MKPILKLFPAGHFAIAALFVAASVGLIVLAAVRLWQGIAAFSLHPVLESIAILTVALAAMELGQTILEEEVLREAHMSAPTRVRRFLSRFMIVLVVALAIETLVLTFRFGGEPANLPYAAAIGLTAAALLVAWGAFVRLNRSAEELEPEAMQRAKREDRKIDDKGGKA